MKTKSIIKILAVAALSFAVFFPSDAKKKNDGPKEPKYVFFFIGDGMGINSVIGTELYNRANHSGPADVNFNQFPVRTFVSTHCSNSLVTDSAASGTALATGHKTYGGAMGVDDNKQPVSNIAEWAHAAGFGTGVATSVGVNHATPSAFYAHTDSRNNYNTIAEQLIATDKLDFAAGAGFLVEGKKNVTAQEFENKAAKAGITVLHGQSQFADMASVNGRVICFSSDPKATELVYAIDRKGGETRLADFTKAGIDYLSSHFPQGFFFMVEGGKIDYAAHNDDVATAFRELSDFTESIDLALAFYDRHPDETLILVTADHDTGGLILGAGEYALRPERLAGQNMSENALTALFRETFKAEDANSAIPSWDAVKAFFTKHLGLWDTISVTAAKEAEFKALYERTFITRSDENVVSLYAVNSRIVSEAIDYADRASGFSWAHGSHSGSPVGLFVKGTAAAQFNSCRDNTDIPKMIAALAGYKK